MLKSRVFPGDFREKRFVDKLESYRDLIVLNPNDTEFADDLLAVRNRIMRFYSNKIWVGYTNTDAFNLPCIWTELKTSIPFGKYWFQVKSIHFRKLEVIIKLKVIREFGPNDTEIPAAEEVSQPQQQENEFTTLNQSKIAENFVEYFQTYKTEFHTSMLKFFSIYITAENTIYAMQYMTILLCALIAGALHSIKHLGFFVIKVMEQLNVFIKVSTPIVLRIIDLLTKIVGGFFILLAMIWRDCLGNKSNNQMPQQRRMQPIEYYSTTRQQPRRSYNSNRSLY